MSAGELVVLAHGAVGPADEIALVVVALVLLVLGVGHLRAVNARRGRPPTGLAEQAPDGRSGA